MMTRRLGTCILFFLFASLGFGQSPGDQNRTVHPTEEQIAKYKRLSELFRHPTFITLRLVSAPRASSREEPSVTPSAYTVEEWIRFQLFITQSSSEKIVIGDFRLDSDYGPVLSRDGDVVSYSKKAQEGIERAEKGPSSGSRGKTYEPGVEYLKGQVNLEDWYDSPLLPGHYQLTVRKRFIPDGDWVESNPVTFDVIPRKAVSPIPDSVSLRLVPDASKPSSLTKPYRLGYDQGIAVELVNDSDVRVPITVIDRYYGHRPQLMKDGKVVPYSDESAKFVDAKEKDPRLVEVVSTLFLDTKTASRLDGFSLKQWYGPLAPGLYRLTDRRRFEIGGPWTKDSAALIFEVAP